MTQPLTLVQRFIDEAWNQGNLDVIPEIMTAPYQARSLNANTPAMGDQDHAAMAAHVQDFRTAFPDLQMTLEDSLSEGDRVFVQTRLTGTNTGPFMGMPPTGKTVEFVLSAVYQAKDGKLIGHRVLVDILGMMQQLGLLPPGPPGAPPGEMPPGPPPGGMPPQ